jgi:hypothetical protein
VDGGDERDPTAARDGHRGGVHDIDVAQGPGPERQGRLAPPHPGLVDQAAREREDDRRGGDAGGGEDAADHGPGVTGHEGDDVVDGSEGAQ